MSLCLQHSDPDRNQNSTAREGSGYFPNAVWNLYQDTSWSRLARPEVLRRPSSPWACFVRPVDPRVDLYRESASSRTTVVWWQGGWLPAGCRGMVLGLGISNVTRHDVLSDIRVIEGLICPLLRILGPILAWAIISYETCVFCRKQSKETELDIISRNCHGIEKKVGMGSDPCFWPSR